VVSSSIVLRPSRIRAAAAGSNVPRCRDYIELHFYNKSLHTKYVGDMPV